MTDQPFTLFSPYADRFRVELLDRSGDAHDDALIAATLGCDNIASLRQVHGNQIIAVHEPTHREEQADGLITDTPNLTLTIRASDCQTFVAYDPELHVTGLLHAGWRGLVAKAIPAFIGALRTELGADPSRLLIAAGPSLCRQCAEFTDPVTELTGINPQFFQGRNADLRAVAEDQLFATGVKPEHFERHPDCTKCDNDRWLSYRGRDREAVAGGAGNVVACTLL